MIKALFSAVAALAMLTASTVATAASAKPAAALSVAKSTRAATPVKGAQKAVETSTLINIGILAALVVGVLVATGGSDDDTPDSP